jgi:hypothetical protein
VVVYAVQAQREGQPPFTAVVSSTYVHDGSAWRLAFHQQSPYVRAWHVALSAAPCVPRRPGAVVRACRSSLLRCMRRKASASG